VYVHFRGRVRHRWTRQPLDHSTIMAPHNALMYLFSAVANRPFVHVRQWVLVGTILYALLIH
jgi:beta-hydroxylase